MTLAPTKVPRFSEKSFEVRFCAAFSAAIMPFNRNPQWFGMTQAQERRNGIDTMLAMGGRLVIFQFKAKDRNGQFKLEQLQWHNLNRVGRRFPNSVYYVFPEAGDIQDAAKLRCILRDSWISPVAKLQKAFKSGADSAVLSLDEKKQVLSKARPRWSEPIENSCRTFGCFCPPLNHGAFGARHLLWNGRYLRFVSPGGATDVGVDQPLPPFPDKLGIPMGDGSGEDSLTSMGEFEELLGDLDRPNSARGLYGLFFPNSRPIGPK